MEGLARVGDGLSDEKGPIPTPDLLVDLDVSGFFQYWLPDVDQRHFCEMLCSLRLTTLALDGNILDQTLVDSLATIPNLCTRNCNLYFFNFYKFGTGFCLFFLSKFTKSQN